jgi:RNA polymerase sigma-70 factor (ECF subfamily)
VIGEEFVALLAAAQDGSEAAFSVLWRDVNPALLRYLRVAAPGAAEDVAAETWVQVVRGLPAFRGEEREWRAWLFTTARRRAIDEGRRRSRHPVASLAEVGPDREPRTHDAAEQAMENLSTAAALTMIAALPPLQAEVILLRVVAGLDNEAVARMVGRSPGAVRVAAHRGLRRLAQTPAAAGVTL